MSEIQSTRSAHGGLQNNGESQQWPEQDRGPPSRYPADTAVTDRSLDHIPFRKNEIGRDQVTKSIDITSSNSFNRPTFTELAITSRDSQMSVRELTLFSSATETNTTLASLEAEGSERIFVVFLGDSEPESGQSWCPGTCVDI